MSLTLPFVHQASLPGAAGCRRAQRGHPSVLCSLNGKASEMGSGRGGANLQAPSADPPHFWTRKSRTGKSLSLPSVKSMLRSQSALQGGQARAGWEGHGHSTPLLRTASSSRVFQRKSGSLATSLSSIASDLTGCQALSAQGAFGACGLEAIDPCP